MDILHFIWFDCLYRPVYNLVLYTYQTLPGHDMGLTIIYLAILVRIILLPVSLAGDRSARRIQDIKPELEKLERVPDAGKRRDLTRKLLRKNRINVYATALVLGVQILFLGLLYQVFQSGFHKDPTGLAYFPVDGPIDTTFFGWFDLAHKNWLLALITAVALYGMLALSTPEPEEGASLSDIWYVIALPFVVFWILFFLPAAKSLFLLTSIAFSIALYFIAKFILRVEPPNVQQNVD